MIDSQAMTRSFTVGQRARALGFYAATLVIAYLAAAYLGGFFVALAITLLLIPLFSFVALHVAASSLAFGRSSPAPTRSRENRSSIRSASRIAR